MMTETTKPKAIVGQKKTAKTSSAANAGKTPEAPIETSAVIGEVSERERVLLTQWSELDGNSATFDHDQAAIHEWTTATAEEQHEALKFKMTLADAEELIESAQEAAAEHRQRAEAAERLAFQVATRLGMAAIRFANEATAPKQSEAPIQPKETPEPATDETRVIPVPAVGADIG